jgi:hypothetical protein
LTGIVIGVAALGVLAVIAWLALGGTDGAEQHAARPSRASRALARCTEWQATLALEALPPSHHASAIEDFQKLACVTGHTARVGNTEVSLEESLARLVGALEHAGVGHRSLLVVADRRVEAAHLALLARAALAAGASDVLVAGRDGADLRAYRVADHSVEWHHEVQHVLELRPDGAALASTDGGRATLERGADRAANAQRLRASLGELRARHTEQAVLIVAPARGLAVADLLDALDAARASGLDRTIVAGAGIGDASFGDEADVSDERVLGVGMLGPIGQPSVSLPDGRTARVRLGAPEVSGMRADAVERIATRHVQELRFCYEQVLRGGASTAGRVVVSFTISPAGTLAEAPSSSGSTLESPALEACLRAAFGRWTYPAPALGEATVRYPLALSVE